MKNEKIEVVDEETDDDTVDVDFTEIESEE